MKGKSYFGYKFLFFIALVVAIANAAAKGYRPPFEYYSPDPQPDTPATKPDTNKLRFPIHDKTGDPMIDNRNPTGIDLQDPSVIQKSVEYDPDSGRYYFNEKLGNDLIRTPTYMTQDEYLKYQGQQDEQDYWQRRLDALTLFNKKPELPQMYKEGIFDRIFGGNTISVKPQGNVDVTFGGNWQNIKNPTLVQRAQKYGIFNFDMQMNINLLATVGDKLKLNISQNTKATFDYQNVQKLEYTGKEDEIIKKIEAGNISFPLKSNLISGVQSLFGIKTQLQFGKLWVTAVLSQQKSQRKSLTIQGGAQTQQFAIKADNYEENRDFLLSQYFHDNYDTALKNFPVIASLVTINKIEVWVTNSTGAVTGVRSALCFQDLGEGYPYVTQFSSPAKRLQNNLPDNNVNTLYSRLQNSPARQTKTAFSYVSASLGLKATQDFEQTTARQLNSSEFSYNPQLGYISLNTQINPSDVLGVAFRYTYNGHVYQVGEFAEDLPPDTTNTTVLFLKLLKGTAPNPTFPIWKLMMKNIYALGGFGVSKDNFLLNIFYQNPGGGETRYLPEGPSAGVPLLTVLNLDRLNAQNQPQPDGVFDFVDGITINTQQGKVIFPTLEPFGRDLTGAVGNNVQLQRKYLYTQLYDSTKTIAQENQAQDRYIMRGSYKSSTSSEVFLGGFNIPPGSVVVTAGGQKLVENQDYQIDYGLGRLKVLNTGILNSGVPINIQYEDNSTFGFTQQNFMGARLDYYLNKHLTLGGTFMHLTERPFTQKVTFGDDPISNTVLGVDANYQSEFPALTKALDKLPVYSTTAPSFINASGEAAALEPGHPKQINALDKEGSVYIDDFEGATSAYDMKLPAISWTLSSTPFGAHDKNGNTLFPEAGADDQLISGSNRAKLAWYFIEPTLVDPAGGVPSYVKNDPNQHYIRLVQQTDVFPTGSYQTLQTSLSTLDLGYYPNERGPYNFDATNIDKNGLLLNPQGRWGGIERPIDNTDFEQSNVEYIQFWVMDPFINNPNSKGGSLYFNLGDVSEDVLKDSRLFFENGIPYPYDSTQLDTTIWGVVPRFAQQITRAFNNDPNARAVQDVGYDGLNNVQEATNYRKFLAAVNGKLSTTAYNQLQSDPSSDDYHYFLGSDYDAANLGV
ncbi:MAG TPA: cell surface protein SprA, partial [Flavipsychrobacter sp.]|nr:cell surface protein SprA [Flavipsychrobacter sp.]